MEIFKKVEGFDYEVSNLGSVKSLISGKILSPSKSGNYYKVTLYKKGKRNCILLHRLVALTFIENVENKPCVNHKNGNKKDNNCENLEWCTASENMIHSYYVLGNIPTNIDKISGFGSDNYRSKKVFQYTKEGALVSDYGGVREAGRITGIDHRSIAAVAGGSIIRKSAGGYVWKYE
jgi:hypothetical protein